MRTPRPLLRASEPRLGASYTKVGVFGVEGGGATQLSLWGPVKGQRRTQYTTPAPGAQGVACLCPGGLVRGINEARD